MYDLFSYKVVGRAATSWTYLLKTSTLLSHRTRQFSRSIKLGPKLPFLTGIGTTLVKVEAVLE